MSERKWVCSIAGYDPSAGAGVSADIKTFEMHQVYGFGVLSAMTWQNDVQVAGVQWLSAGQILDQLALLLPRFKVDYYKIGIIENLECLLQVCSYVKQLNPKATIIWDPVIRATADFPFFQGEVDFEVLQGKLDWITPNQPEFQKLFHSSHELALQLSRHFSILKKGGHDPTQQGRDLLYYREQCHVLEAELQQELINPKHGSGCVLSAALCANLARGAAPLEACRMAKRYIEKFLASHSSLLGWHNG